ncbi:aminopeptidase N [Ancylobacter dichloromethanicus]|uniref:Aminopeptidase N n=1 Tax=Ancylobacter dichloromethanicus TaxID=518825 RepID=A0A9W6J551_9HYPH|nr:aminopeptidase N [Ancylobacter dichloromethanicus]MBS7556179.1 aminopeptidase N [Ancylobacter dichloromethanicus]GLK69933.1 aminopeptidase N [Ancylobacter dichloromethanicus]
MSRDAVPQPVRLGDYRPPDWLVDTVHLDVRLHPTAARIVARLALRPNPEGREGSPIVLDGDELNLKSVTLDGAPLAGSAYVATSTGLTLLAPPQRALTLEIETVVDPSANTRLMGLYRSSGTYCTQCEAEGFRRITYFPDRPDVLAVYTTRIEAERDEAPVLLGNGNPVEAGAVEDTSRHYAVWHDPWPKPSYLFALVGGKLDRITEDFVTATGKTVELGIYVEPGKTARAGYAMDALKRAMRWDEEAFGCEYDLDVFNIVAVADFNMGAMENKGLNIFNDKYVLASPETATDADYANIEAIIAHEYFHNWTGNRITCRDWFQLCLKEGLTVFRDQEFSSDQRSRPVKRIADVRLLKGHQFPEDSGPLAHPVRPSSYREINNFYTATVYEKGAEVVRMLKTVLGDEGFRAGMDLYLDRHDGDAATVEDFLACFADANGIDLTQFALWYAQSGTPRLAVSGHWDEAARSYRLDVAQTLPPTPGQSEKLPMVIPLAIGLVGPDGRDLPLALDDGSNAERGVLLVTKPRQSFVFRDVPHRPVPSLNRGFSAPVKLSSDLSTADLLFLARHDSDPFNRFDATQTLALSHLLEATSAVRAGGEQPAPDALVEALAATLGDTSLDPAFVAQALSIPSEADVAREIGEDVDPDAIHAARTRLRHAVGEALAPALEAVYARHAPTGNYSPDAASAGRRALRNTCLDLLAAGGTAKGIARAQAHFGAADNMTDRFFALAVLAHAAPDAREDALAAFHRQFRADPLVVDKWLALQAQIAEPQTLERVRDLTGHADFDWSNPNRVRALIGTFAGLNPTQFHRADGAGHDLVAGAVMDIDGRNPQLAARLLAAFKSWRSLEPVRRASAEAALRRVAGKPSLSPDVTDIVSRSLD